MLLKGGHGAGGDAVDFLARNGTLRFAKPRIATRNTHGTGCTLAAAITAGLAKGLELADAVAQAKDFLWAALVSGADMRFGAGKDLWIISQLLHRQGISPESTVLIEQSQHDCGDVASTQFIRRPHA